jgi:hypothetical protein
VRSAAAQLVFVSTRSGIAGTTVDWAVLGAAGTVVPSGAAVGAGGVHFTVATAGGGPMAREDEATCGQDMLDFFPCEHLLSTSLTPLTGLGPMTFTFDHPISGFGLNASPHGLGAFALFLDAFRGGTFLGSAHLPVPGNQHGSNDGSAPFIGLLSPSPDTDFDTVVLDQTGAPPAGWFAVNGPVIAVRSTTVVTPEPLSLAGVGTGLVALALARVRRRARAAAQPRRPHAARDPRRRARGAGADRGEGALRPARGGRATLRANLKEAKTTKTT